MPKTNRCTAVSRVYSCLRTIVAPAFGLFFLALPASAQIEGYGKDATGGAGGSVCTVTTSAGSGNGSFSSCLSQGNRTIQFAVPTTTVSSTQYVRSNTTIDGCANGQNGVTIDQTAASDRAIRIEGPVSNVIVRCMRFQGSGTPSEEFDLLALDGADGLVSRVLIDRSTFVGAPDGALDMTGDVSDVTVQRSLLYGSVLTQLIKYQTRTRLSIHHNVYTAGAERNPQIKGDATKIDFVSNVVHANTIASYGYGTRLHNGNSSSDSPGNVQINLVANAYMGTNGHIEILTESGASASGIYIASNNYCSPASNCPSSPASSPQFTAATGYGVTPTLPGCMASAMLPTVGAPNRTATDTQKLNAVASALPTNCTGGSTPTVSIGDASVTEGNSGTTTATFTATLSAAATGNVTVNFATANGTATSGSDYVAQTGTLTFTAGQTSKTISVVVNGDTTGEANETFLVNLSTPSGATILDGQGLGTIVTDDSLPQLSINDISLSEGNTGTQAATFTVTLSAASTSPVSVTYVTANGTATAGSDYASVGGSVTIPAGSTTQTVTVTVNGDTTVEPNETFVVNLSGASGATIQDAQGTGTITNDDTAPTPTLSIGDASVSEGNSSTKTVTFTATLSASSSSTVTVNYSTANGTATAGSDYVAKSGTLTFTSGQTSKTLTVTINGDTTVEPNETFTVNLASPSGATILDGQGVGTITNDDAALPTLSIGDASVSEGNSSTKTVTFTATLSPSSSSTVTVNYSTANGTATSGSDYVSKTGTLTFTSGQTSKTLTVTINGDTTVEPNETFTVNLASPSGATILDGQAVGTITNDDATLPTLSISDATVAEGNSGTTTANFTVTLSASSSSTVTATYSTINGTATSGSDYVAGSGTLTFTAGQTTKTIAVVVNGDTTVEANETFIVNLASPSGATLLDAQGTGTITNDDSAQSGVQPVVWTSMVGVSANAGSLTKTAITAWGNAGAVSSHVLASGNGYVEFTATETTTYRLIGLSNGDSSQDYTDIDFGIDVALSEIRLYEKGVFRGSFGSYASGDKLRVAVESGVVKYLKNGTVFYTSASVPVFPLLVDASLYNQGATLSNAVVSGAWAVNTTPPSSSAPVVWTSMVGVSANAGSLVKTAVIGWGNAGAVSSQSLASGDGYVEFTATETNTYRLIGLSNGNSDVNYEDIDYAIDVALSEIRLYEKGVFRGSFGSYASGDKLRVSVESGVVKYLKNGTVLYTSAAVPTYPLLVDSSLYNTGATLTNAVVSGVWQ